MTRWNRSRLLVCVTALLALGALMNVAWAMHPWGNYHWARTKNPFTLKLGDNVASGWDSYLAQTSSDWNAGETPVQTAVVPGQSTSKRCSAIAGTTQVCNNTYGRNGWLGLATIYISGGHITHGTAKMNDTYFVMSKYNNGNEKQHVMCQEVAHTFGLDHQSEDGSSQRTCMDYSSSPDSTKPNAHDFEQLKAIYEHLDNSTTVAAAPTTSAAASEDVSDTPNRWGMLVSQSNNGRSSTYEFHEQDGRKIVTHVYWTEEAASRCAPCDHRYEGGH